MYYLGIDITDLYSKPYIIVSSEHNTFRWYKYPLDSNNRADSDYPLMNGTIADKWFAMPDDHILRYGAYATYEELLASYPSPDDIKRLYPELFI